MPRRTIMCNDVIKPNGRTADSHKDGVAKRWYINGGCSLWGAHFGIHSIYHGAVCSHSLLGLDGAGKINQMESLRRRDIVFEIHNIDKCIPGRILWIIQGEHLFEQEK